MLDVLKFSFSPFNLSLSEVQIAFIKLELMKKSYFVGHLYRGWTAYAGVVMNDFNEIF